MSLQMDLHHELYEGFNNFIYIDLKKKKKTNTNEISHVFLSVNSLQLFILCLTLAKTKS